MALSTITVTTNEMISGLIISWMGFFQLPSNYIVKPFPTVHRVASQGYIIYEHTKELKPEFKGLPSHVIAQKVREGQEINDIQEIPCIAYTGMDKIKICRDQS